MRLAWRAQRANQRWNRAATAWNAARTELARAVRMPDGNTPPPPFAHLSLHGEVRIEWEPGSTLFNTDGQVFSDLGVPVVLVMETTTSAGLVTTTRSTRWRTSISTTARR